MTTNGISGFGTVLAGSTCGTIAEVINIDLSGIEVSEIEIGSMDSTNGYLEYIAGMANPGEISLTLVYYETQAETLYDNVGTSDTWTITTPDSSTFVAAGFIKSLGTAIPFDGKIEQSCVFKISGKPVFTAA